MVMRFYPFKEVTSRVAVLDEIPAAAPDRRGNREECCKLAVFAIVRPLVIVYLLLRQRE